MKHILLRSIFGALWAIVILLAVVLFLNPHSRNLGALILACISPVVVLFFPRRHRTWVGIMLLSLNFSVLVGTYAESCRRQNDITRGHNMSSAIYSLRALCSAEETFKAAGLKDEDGDGVGEYGTLRELAGLDPLAGKGVVADPPFIDGQLGLGAKSSYHFTLQLGEEADGKAATIDGTESSFFAVAWPVKDTDVPGVAERSFCIDETEILRFRDGQGRPVTREAAVSGPDPWDQLLGLGG